MARKSKNANTTFKEKDLTKGQIRKLNALKKSIGDDLGAKAFSEWLVQQEKEPHAASDPVADAIAETVAKLLDDRKFRLPRQGYIVKRGRGRIIVQPVSKSA